MPAMNVGLGFDLKLCTGLSHSIVAAGAVGSVLYGLVQPSPLDGSKTLLNFDIALTLIPAMLFGVSFGARPCSFRFREPTTNAEVAPRTLRHGTVVVLCIMLLTVYAYTVSVGRACTRLHVASTM